MESCSDCGARFQLAGAGSASDRRPPRIAGHCDDRIRNHPQSRQRVFDSAEGTGLARSIGGARMHGLPGADNEDQQAEVRYGKTFPVSRAASWRGFGARHWHWRRLRPRGAAAYGSSARFLQQARGELDVAARDKAGHRVTAIGLIDQAIHEVQAGMAAAGG